MALTFAPAVAKLPVSPKAAIATTLTQQLKDDFTRHTQIEIVDAIKPVDINRDGIQDWQVDFDAFGSAWCGTGGCRYQLWLGRRNAVPLLVFDRQMRDLKIVRRGKRNVFVFDFHGTECGGFGAQACPGEFVWNQGRGRMILLPTPRKHTSTANPIIAF
ncbi:MAG: hypothetical protein ACKOPE_03210 [Novosphingobium sp.]